MYESQWIKKKKTYYSKQLTKSGEVFKGAVTDGYLAWWKEHLKTCTSQNPCFEQTNLVYCLKLDHQNGLMKYGKSLNGPL